MTRAATVGARAALRHRPSGDPTMRPTTHRSVHSTSLGGARPHRTTAVAAATLGVVLLVSGCATDGSAGAGRPEPGSAPTAVTSTTAPTATVPDLSVVVDAVDPAAVLAEAVFDVPGSPGDTVRVGVESLVASGPTMELRLVVTPELASPDENATVRISDLAGDSTWRPTLTDTAHLKEYSILRSSGQRWETDTSQARTTSGTSLRYQAWFAHPEDDAQTLDLAVTAAWPLFEGVPITYEG